MAGRNRLPPHLIHLHDHHPPPPALLGRGPHPGALMDDPHLRRPHPHHPPHHVIAAMEERLDAQHREIQALLIDNQRLAATHVALKQELTAAQHDHRLAVSAARKAEADRDAELRDLYDRAARAEAECRAIDGMRAELGQVGSDVQKLRAVQEELVQRLQGLREELSRVQSEVGKAPEIREQIEDMHKEIQKGRAAVDYEKKMRANNIEQSENMEKNMISMAREVEKLRGELANAEKRARAAAAAAAATAAANPGSLPGSGYNAGSYGNSEMAYGGGTYGDPYSRQQAQRGADGSSQYGARGADGGSQYGSGVVSRGPYDMQPSTAR